MPSIPRTKFCFIPIERAVVEPGRPAGPALVAARDRKELAVSYWDGKLWHDLDGFPIVMPVALAWLPSVSEVLALVA